MQAPHEMLRYYSICSDSIRVAVWKLNQVLIPEFLPYEAAPVQETTQQGSQAGARISFLPSAWAEEHSRCTRKCMRSHPLHRLDESVETVLVLLSGHTRPLCAPSSSLQCRFCLETSLWYCKVNRKLLGTLLRITKNRLLFANKNYLYKEQKQQKNLGHLVYFMSLTHCSILCSKSMQTVIGRLWRQCYMCLSNCMLCNHQTLAKYCPRGLFCCFSCNILGPKETAICATS